MKGIIALLFFAADFYGHAQSSFPKDVYLNVEQLRARLPAFNPPIQIIPKSKYPYKTSNSYKLRSPVDSINGHYTKFKILAYSSGDTLLINSLSNSNYSFSPALTKGNFIVFKTIGKAADPGLLAATFMFGIIGTVTYDALTNGSSNVARARSKWQILSLRTGNIRPFTREYITERLKQHPEIFELFKKEKKKISLEMMIQYVNILNERTSYMD